LLASHFLDAFEKPFDLNLTFALRNVTALTETFCIPNVVANGFSDYGKLRVNRPRLLHVIQVSKFRSMSFVRL
jgi:hypothetical protein